jgi:hypothetical protein
MKSRQIAAQLLEMIAWGHPKVLIRSRVVEHLKLAKKSVLDIGGNPS